MKRPCIYAPSLIFCWTSPGCFFVTSHVRHILSRGSSFFLAVLCMIAVRNDCGLKKPGSQTEEGKLKSDVQPSNSLILRSRSAYQADKPLRDAYANLVQDGGTLKKLNLNNSSYYKVHLTWSKNRESERSSISDVIVNSPFKPKSNSLRLLLISATSKFILSHSYIHDNSSGKITFCANNHYQTWKQTMTYGVLSSTLPINSLILNNSGSFSITSSTIVLTLSSLKDDQM